MKRAGFGTHRRHRLDLLLCSSYFKKLVIGFGSEVEDTVTGLVFVINVVTIENRCLFSKKM